jgi:hypothetical protein
MTVKIATVPSFPQAADAVVRVWEDAGKPKLLRFEGFDGVGKSGLAKLVASRIGAEHVEGDTFACKRDVPTPYWECLSARDLEDAIGEAVESDAPVILDAVCLEKVAPSRRWGRGFVVYVKRLSFNNTNPIWHGGFWLEDEDETPPYEPHHGIVQYHREFSPHERADLISAGRKTYSSAGLMPSADWAPADCAR